MRFISIGLALCVYGVCVSADSLPVQGANLAVCVQALPGTYSLEEKYHLCELRRARSLLYKGNSVCPGRVPADVLAGCYPEDSAGALSTSEHAVTSGLRPVIGGDMAQVYGGHTFTHRNQSYRINASGAVQVYNGWRWNTSCALNLDISGCLSEQGQAITRASRLLRDVEPFCTYQSIQFEPGLFKMTIIEGNAEIESYSKYSANLRISRRYYRCSVIYTAVSVAWN